MTFAIAEVPAGWRPDRVDTTNLCQKSDRSTLGTGRLSQKGSMINDFFPEQESHFKTFRPGRGSGGEGDEK